MILLTFSCQPELADDHDAELTTELRTSGCDCLNPSGDTPPVVINVEDGCEMQNGQCCFDLRISSAYVVPNPPPLFIPANLLCPEFGFSQSFTEDPETGLYHFCISCASTFFIVKIFNFSTNKYDCFEYDSPCN